MPYASGGSPTQWTTYEFDARGRTTKVTPPGNAGFTRCVYAGNTVTVIEPVASRWKKYTMNSFGNPVQVEEPKPGTTGARDWATTASATWSRAPATARH